MSGQIPIGAQLRQAELATELGVSRTPVREALRQLHTSGLIEVVPNRGAVVRVPSPWEVRDAYEVRAELEGLACERAVSRINDVELKELRAANQSMRDEIAEPTTHGETGEEPPTVEFNDTFHTLIHTRRRQRVAGAGDHRDQPGLPPQRLLARPRRQPPPARRERRRARPHRRRPRSRRRRHRPRRNARPREERRRAARPLVRGPLQHRLRRLARRRLPLRRRDPEASSPLGA